MERIIESNMDKVSWYCLPKNPNALHLIFENLDQDLVANHINWSSLSANPNAIAWLEENQGKIDWQVVWKNPNIFRNKPTKSAQLYMKLK